MKYLTIAYYTKADKDIEVNSFYSKCSFNCNKICFKKLQIMKRNVFFFADNDYEEISCARRTCECDRIASECFARNEFHWEFYDLDPFFEHCSEYPINQRVISCY